MYCLSSTILEEEKVQQEERMRMESRRQVTVSWDSGGSDEAPPKVAKAPTPTLALLLLTLEVYGGGSCCLWREDQVWGYSKCNRYSANYGFLLPPLHRALMCTHSPNLRFTYRLFKQWMVASGIIFTCSSLSSSPALPPLASHTRAAWLLLVRELVVVRGLADDRVKIRTSDGLKAGH